MANQCNIRNAFFQVTTRVGFSTFKSILEKLTNSHAITATSCLMAKVPKRRSTQPSKEDHQAASAHSPALNTSEYAQCHRMISYDANVPYDRWWEPSAI
eukprot:gene986-4229_t